MAKITTLLATTMIVGILTGCSAANTATTSAAATCMGKTVPVEHVIVYVLRLARKQRHLDLGQ